MGLLSRIITSSPYPELMARKIYYTLLRNGIDLKRKRSKKKNGKRVLAKDTNKVDPDLFFKHLKDIGIKEGDLLVVHSSTGGLRSVTCDESELLERLINLVGETGTIALPAFPKETWLKEENGLKIYDPKRSLAWTGLLPNLLLERKGAIRSLFPCNPLVALGPLSEEMMAHNLETVYAHDHYSCWGFCAEHHAKVLFLGVSSYHSNTIGHVVEDYQPKFWPEGWYEEKEYYVKKQDQLSRVKVRIRKVEWAKYLAERYTQQKYIQAGYIKKLDFDKIQIHLIEDAYEFVNAIMGDWKKMRFFYLPERFLHKQFEKKGLTT